MSLFLALSFYTAAFIAEIVRSGIRGVAKGQSEAAGALGLHPSSITRLVVVPQALRIIIPPLTSQYLNLTKNSSLAIAIGFADYFAVSGTILNQTGQAVELMRRSDRRPQVPLPAGIGTNNVPLDYFDNRSGEN